MVKGIQMLNTIKTNKVMASILVCAGLYFAPVASETSVANATESVKKSKKVPAMRNRVYSQLARAQALSDKGDKIEGFEVLDDVKDRLDSLNSYERAMLWNFYGFMYYGNDDIGLAIDSFEQVINETNIPDSLKMSTLYSLSQLSMGQQDFKKALSFLNQWKQLKESSAKKDLMANQYVLFAQIYYQDKQFHASLKHINQAITAQKKHSDVAKRLPKEPWLILQRANYFELKQPEKVTEVMEALVRYYSKPAYWLQLSAMYGETDQEDKQLAVMEAAWQAGYITKASDVLTLAQLYRFHNVPFKAADLLDNTIKNGVISAEEKHLDLLAQSFIAAKEEKEAVNVLTQLTKINDSGKYEAQLAQVYLNQEEWTLAIQFAKKAIKRGSQTLNETLGTMYIVLGMASANLATDNSKYYQKSLNAFDKAKQYKKVTKMAQQWFKYVEREQQHKQQLAERAS